MNSVKRSRLFKITMTNHKLPDCHLAAVCIDRNDKYWATLKLLLTCLMLQ